MAGSAQAIEELSQPRGGPNASASSVHFGSQVARNGAIGQREVAARSGIGAVAGVLHGRFLC
jgi:hypothetical protein